MIWVKRIGLAGILAGGVVCSSTPALADQKSYHGAFCQGRTAADQADLIYDDVGVTVLDTDLFLVGVYCPMIRDRRGSATNVDDFALELHNASGFIQCTFASQVEDVGGATLDSTTDSTNTIGDVQLHDFSIIETTSGSSSGNEGTYFVVCAMGGEGDSIYHYWVNEENSSD